MVIYFVFCKAPKSVYEIADVDKHHRQQRRQEELRKKLHCKQVRVKRTKTRDKYFPIPSSDENDVEQGLLSNSKYEYSDVEKHHQHRRKQDSCRKKLHCKHVRVKRTKSRDKYFSVPSSDEEDEEQGLLSNVPRYSRQRDLPPAPLPPDFDF